MNSLTPTESTTLQQCEAVIERGMNTFVEVGSALLTVSDQRLYRETHSTFDSWVQDKYKMSARHAYRLCEASEVVKELRETVTHGSQTDVNERQARELAKAPKGQRAETLKKAQALAGDSKLTAAHIAQTISQKSFCTDCQTAYIKADGHKCKDAAQAEEERELIRKAALQQQAKDAFKGLVIPPEVSPRNNFLATVEAVVVCIPTLTTVLDINAGLLELRVAVKKMEEHLKAVRMEGEA